MVWLTDWIGGSDSIFPSGSIPADGESADEASLSSDAGRGGGTLRLLAAAGLNASTSFSRVFNGVESRFWDVHRLRHIIKPIFNLHLAGASVERDELLPLDPAVEGAHGASAANFGIHQRWQTKRGGPGAWRTVDWMRLDLDFTAFFNDPTRTWFEPEFTRQPPEKALAAIDNVFARGEYFSDRPENSLARSTFNWYYEWRASDTLTLLWDGNLGSGGLDRNNFGVAIQRSPRWRMFFGSRYIRALDTNELLFQSHYKINRKYDMLFSYAFDTIRGRTASTQVTLVRKFQRFYAALTVDISNIADSQNRDGRQLIMLTIWPEGARELTLGERSFSEPGTTTSSTHGW